ncbi:MAG: hypothetical protein ACXIVG_07765 [Pararhodobacter sp.]
MSRHQPVDWQSAPEKNAGGRTDESFRSNRRRGCTQPLDPEGGDGLTELCQHRLQTGEGLPALDGDIDIGRVSLEPKARPDPFAKHVFNQIAADVIGTGRSNAGRICDALKDQNADVAPRET